MNDEVSSILNDNQSFENSNSFWLRHSPENYLMWNIAGQNRPRSQVQYRNEFNEIQDRQARTEEHAHPHHSLVIHQVKDILSNLEVAVLEMKVSTAFLLF